MAITSTLIKSFQLSTLATALALAGCGGGGGNDTLQPAYNPDNANNPNSGSTTTSNLKDIDKITITKSFDTFTLKQDEKFTLVANALKNGSPVAGVIIEAVIPDPATSGIYVTTPSPITTNSNGEAAIEFQVKDLAKATAYLNANNGKIAVSTKPTNSKQAVTGETINLSGAAPSTSTETTSNINNARSLTLSPSNANFKLEVGTQITVSAFVADNKGGALKDVPVTFDLPNLPSLGIYNLSGSTVNTDEKGIATITLQVMSLDKKDELKNGFQVDAFIDRETDLKASNRPTFKGVDNIDSNTGSATAESLVNTIALTPNVDSIPLSVGSTFTLTVTANDKDNKPVSNAPIAFTYPTLAEYGLTVANSSATTNASGQAVVTFTVNSLTTSQKAKLIEGLTVNASSNGKFAKATLTAKNETAESLVSSVSLTPNVDTISLAPNAKFTLTATTLGTDGKPVANAPVTFNYPILADYGLTVANSTNTTNATGQAVITFAVNASLTSAQKAKLIEGFTVNASSNNKTATAVTLKAPKEATVADIAKVGLVTDKTTLITNTDDTINVTAQISDAYNNRLANMPVTFNLIDPTSATGIFAATPLQATTDGNGEAKVTLKVGALTPDQKYYLQTSGLSFKATAGAITSSIVTLKTQQANIANSVRTLLLTSDAAVQIAVGSKVKVTALAMDANGAVVPNAQVSFKVPTDSGLVNNTGAVVTTNASGEATIELEVKDLAKATASLQNGVVVSAQSGVSAGTTTIRGATSNANTDAYKFFMTQSKDVMNTSSDKVTVSVRVTDINGGIKANVPVYLQLLDDGTNYGLSFSTPSTLETDANGIATFDVVQSDIGLLARLDHHVKFKAIVNDGVYKAIEQTIEMPVKGTRIENINLSRTQLLATDSFDISKGTLLDGNGKPLANMPIELANNGSTTSLGLATVTDAQGNFAFNNIAVSKFNANQDGSVNIAAKIGTGNTIQVIDSIATLNIIAASNTSLAYQGSSENLRINQVTPITINAPTIADGSAIAVSATRGTLSTTNAIGTDSRILTTVKNGKAVVYINSVSPGQAKITVQTIPNQTELLSLDKNGNPILDANGKPKYVMETQTTTLVEDTANFVSISPAKMALQLEKTIVSTNGATRVIAKVLDANDAPVKNAIVAFNIVNDPSSGTLTGATAITDASGQAVVNYNAGAVPSPIDAVQIQATVNSLNIYNDQGIATETPLTSLTPPLSPLSQTQALTVQTFSSSIGVSFADKITDDDRHVYYLRNGSIYVTNSVGQPAANSQVSISIIPNAYYKGYYKVIDQSNDSRTLTQDLVWKVMKDTDSGDLPLSFNPMITENTWIHNLTVIPMNSNPQSVERSIYEAHTQPHECLNEDTNLNNFLDLGEDINANGQLDPINSVVVLDANGNKLEPNQTLMTDATGKLDFTIRYPKEYAQWMTANVRVSTKVDGTESVQSRGINFPVLNTDVTPAWSSSPLRPNWYSPFGTYSCFSGK